MLEPMSDAVSMRAEDLDKFSVSDKDINPSDYVPVEDNASVGSDSAMMEFQEG